MKKSGFVYVKTMDGEIRLIRTAKETMLKAGDCVTVNDADGVSVVAQCISDSFETDSAFIGKALNCDPEMLPMVTALFEPKMIEIMEEDGGNSMN